VSSVRLLSRCNQHRFLMLKNVCICIGFNLLASYLGPFLSPSKRLICCHFLGATPKLMDKVPVLIVWRDSAGRLAELWALDLEALNE
jgi:hypothetical protein